MKFAYDVPGYLCGHRYTQDSRFWDAANNRFLDLALYGNHVRKTAGTPAFSNHGGNNREGLLLDNSTQFEMENPIPWEGTAVVVMKGHTPGATNLYTYLFGDAVSATSNGMLILQTLGGANPVTAALTAPTGVLSSGNVSNTQDTIFVAAFAMDQETRKAYRTADGVTVNESAAAAVTVNGNAMATGWNGNIGLAGSLGSRMVRIGNNSGVVGDVAANATNYVWVFEQHFFKGNALRNSLAQLKAFMDTLKIYYGLA
jgi:hypothetical protein